MPRFHTIDVYPYSGHVDRPWSEDADADAFAKTARRVCEAYSRALAAQDLHGKNSTLLLHLDRVSEEHTADLDHVHVVVDTDHREGPESARVTLPAGVAALSAPARALLVLDVVHGAALRLAQARSMDVARLDLVRQAVLGDGLRFLWSSAPKVSPDRRHRASVLVELADDGFGRSRILVHRRDEGDLVAVSDEHLAYSSSEGFTRAATTLRWLDSQTVQLTPYSDWLDTTRGAVTLTLPVSPSPSLPVEPPPVVEAVTADLPRPAVVVEGRGFDAPEGNEFPQWIQGGARFFVEGFDLFGYAECLDATVELMAAAPDWKRWWESGGQPGVDLVVHVQALDDDHVWPAALRDPQAVTARRFTDRVEVHYRTTAPSPQGPLEHVAEWARQDLDRAVTKLRKRFRLAQQPDLPHLNEALLGAAQALAEIRARNMTG
ncbi:hypothetical protein OG218_00965 [Kineococcus sp. NBC_00420]|uniref:hypothetical protein n=1 Tax=Kineococcus sp. NBC_00420 TaxID=2903564 RepID=UPI002E1E599C